MRRNESYDPSVDISVVEKKISTLVRTFSRSNISIYIEVENNSKRELKTKLYPFDSKEIRASCA